MDLDFWERVRCTIMELDAVNKFSSNDKVGTLTETNNTDDSYRCCNLYFSILRDYGKHTVSQFCPTLLNEFP